MKKCSNMGSLPGAHSHRGSAARVSIKAVSGPSGRPSSQQMAEGDAWRNCLMEDFHGLLLGGSPFSRGLARKLGKAADSPPHTVELTRLEVPLRQDKLFY